MKYATIEWEGMPRVAVLDSEQALVHPLPLSIGAAATDMLALIRSGLRPTPEAGWDKAVPLEEVSLLAPIPRPARNIFCVGKNYHEHAHEFSKSGFDSSVGANGSAIPDFPIIFSKVPECVVGPRDAIRYPDGASDQVDYEGEIAVIIGREGRAISRSDAYSHVWGYTLINDVTARDLQARHKQWLLGKSLDGFGPMGPAITLADALDPAMMTLQCWVNGELRQQASTSDLIFDIPEIIASISAGITLYPGDIIATGTPAGVGIGFEPPRFLARGDRIEVEVDGIGRLSNQII